MKTPVKNKMVRPFLKPSKTLTLIIGILAGLILLLETSKLLKITVLTIPLQYITILPITLALIALIALIDLIRLFTQKIPQVERILPQQLSINQWDEVGLLLTNQEKTQLTIQVYDYPPNQIIFNQLPQTIKLDRYPYLLKYAINPLVRGYFAWQTCELTMHSKFGLWQKLHYLPLVTETKIYPDFTKLYGSHLKTIEQWIHYLGVRPQQRRGLGQDFHQLREFREGDNLRQIDWKATAKQGYPITKEYQDERDQQIIFLLDCGQRMRTQEDNLSHFDHALNACLLLAYVALRQGDAVGLTTFATDKECYLAPKKGVAQLTALLNAVYNLQPSFEPADYNRVIHKLLTKVKRRSLVIIITNLGANQNEDSIKSFKLLSRHHKVLIASMREEVLDKLREEPIHDLQTALTYCGDIKHILNRTKLHEKLLAHKLPILDVCPTQFGPQLINHYLSLKRAGSL